MPRDKKQQKKDVNEERESLFCSAKYKLSAKDNADANISSYQLHKMLISCARRKRI